MVGTAQHTYVHTFGAAATAAAAPAPTSACSNTSRERTSERIEVN